MQSLVYSAILIILFSTTTRGQKSMYTNYLQLSQDFIYAAKAEGETVSYIDTLANADESDLERELDNDNTKKAFFINLYNAYTQVILKKNPDKYKKRNAFFNSKQINIAGHVLSLDNIEHGILRHSRTKWSLGYFGKLFPGKFERKFRVATVDYRIHFTLNCGAKSCPLIAFYSPEELNSQLDQATTTYLHNDAEYKRDQNTMYLPALMSWFRGDFGGKKGELKLCTKLNIVPAGVKSKIKYKHYDWHLYLNNFKN